MRIGPRKLIAAPENFVYWLGEDEAGNVAAVGEKLCVIRADATEVIASKYQEMERYIFVSGKLLGILELPTGDLVFVGPKANIHLPDSAREVFFSSYLPSTQEVHLLTRKHVVKVSLRENMAHIVAELPIRDDGNAWYEKISTSEKLVIACRYGLSIWTRLGETHTYDQEPYSEACIVSDDRVVATHENGDIHIYDLRQGLLKRMNGPECTVLYFLGLVDDELVIVWGIDGPGKYVTSRFGGVIKDGRLVLKTNLGTRDFSRFATAPELKCLAIGSSEGGVLLWDVSTAKTRYLRVPESVRRVHWSSVQRRLFAGTNDGKVYAWEFG